MKTFYVYMLASRRNGTLYVGVTSNLLKRAHEHREGFVDGFSKKYGTYKLVWYEAHDSAEAAITREKQIKKWNRDWKLKRIDEMNPLWDDLYETLNG